MLSIYKKVKTLSSHANVVNLLSLTALSSCIQNKPSTQLRLSPLSVIINLLNLNIEKMANCITKYHSNSCGKYDCSLVIMLTLCSKSILT